MDCSRKNYRSADMQILVHHMYEYKKGLRSLVLHTMNADNQSMVEELLERKGINFFIQKISAEKMNIFFGNSLCVRIIKSFGDKLLSDYTDEEDFILGTMLGYDRIQQCERYMQRKNLVEDNNKVDKLVGVN